MTGPLHLLDGTLLFFRALYGTPDVFHDELGRSVNGVRGYLSFLLRHIEAHQVTRCVVAFDESLTTCWRNEIYPEYKANRPPADEDLLRQLDCCREVTGVLGITALADLAFEADDFIATLARRVRSGVVIVTRDKDLQQLLRDGVTILHPADGGTTDLAQFRERFGFAPELFADYQALAGDSVDNVPGVQGVGPKTAQRLVGALGDLEGIYADESAWTDAGVKPGSRIAERLREARDAVFLYRRVLRLDHRVPLPRGVSSGRMRRPARSEVDAALVARSLSGGLGSGVARALDGYCA